MCKMSTIWLVAGILCASSSLAAGPESQKANRPEPRWKQVAFNHGVLQTDKDAEIFMYVLSRLHDGDQEKVVAFMDYQLDEIVCGLWANMERMNPWQKKKAMKRLREIKEYRRKHPRIATETVIMEEVSSYLFEKDPTVSTQAAQILKGL